VSAIKHFIAGLDEAGRGPLAGPVVASAVILNPERPIVGLGDSKKLSEKKREALYEPIFSQALSVGIGVVCQEQIDRMNILQASLCAMKLAFEELSVKAQEAWVDGNQRVPFESHIIQKTFVGGDSLHECIMAASIIAKVHRDKLMLEYAKLYPEYGFEQHKGYGTAMHLKALEKHGPCPIHRLSFAPVKNFVQL
jgi:ribonuclease HII